ncbi:MAG TPA: ester cyclase [Mucilaginibacter sp.]|jgi:predicted SnoaL-like aldol condensation-catalyzing enzyme
MRKLTTSIVIAAVFLTSCKSNPGSSGAGIDALKKNKQTGLNAVIALSKRNIDGMLKYCTDSYIDFGDGSAKPLTNKDSLIAAFKEFFSACPNFTGKNFVAVADSNIVIVTGEWTGTFKRAYGPFKPNERTFKIPEADIYTFDETGKITSHRSIQSEVTTMYQLGLLVPAKN